MSRPSVTVLIPAHNEEICIAATVESLLAQNRPPDRILVVADNCTDNTVREAMKAGASVMITRGNTAKKAGALNQALAKMLPDLTEYVLTMDADTTLVPTWIEDALKALEENPDAGAVSGNYRARDGKGLIALLQKIEYHQVHRRISRKGGHVYVLSGTATLFEPETLSRLYRDRGYIYDERSRVEDFEMTLALRFLGYHPRTFKHLITITDVMETWRDLTRQRLRWQHGTLETLMHYGFRKYTRALWLGQITSYLLTFVFFAMFLAWGLTVYMGVPPDPRWLLITPVFVLAQFVETRRAGFRSTALAVLLLPLWLYDLYRLWIYWVAALRVVRRHETVWQ